MRNMSFFLTTEQVREQTKDVTRRRGWSDLKPGERVQAVVKGQGIPKGEKVEKIVVIECVSNRRERLKEITQDECRREGFPQFTPEQFVKMFCEHNGCGAEEPVNRIEFAYVNDATIPCGEA